MRCINMNTVQPSDWKCTHQFVMSRQSFSLFLSYFSKLEKHIFHFLICRNTNLDVVDSSPVIKKYYNVDRTASVTAGGSIETLQTLWKEDSGERRRRGEIKDSSRKEQQMWRRSDVVRGVRRRKFGDGKLMWTKMSPEEEDDENGSWTVAYGWAKKLMMSKTP